jgi:hypothetical protein
LEATASNGARVKPNVWNGATSIFPKVAGGLETLGEVPLFLFPYFAKRYEGRAGFVFQSETTEHTEGEL